MVELGAYLQLAHPVFTLGLLALRRASLEFELGLEEDMGARETVVGEFVVV